MQLAHRQVHKDFTLWPLRSDDPPAASEIVSLEAALEDGFVSLSRSDARTVSLVSRAATPVAVLAGERLGCVGLASRSRLVAPRARVEVPVVEGLAPDCTACARELAGAFRPIPGQVGFVLAAHDRAVALEWLWPGWLCAARLARRLRAWTPWLLREEARAEREGALSGDAAPEALLDALGPIGPPPGRGLVHRVRMIPGRTLPWRA